MLLQILKFIIFFLVVRSLFLWTHIVHNKPSFLSHLDYLNYAAAEDRHTAVLIVQLQGLHYLLLNIRAGACVCVFIDVLK